MKNNEIEQTNARRSFLKKAAYVVPTVIAISQITSPMSAQAASSRTQIKTGSQEVNPNNAAGTDASDAKNIFGRK
ncbi:MAG: hypothetical protein KBA17_11140 [Aliarcobacter sp.]|jgi:hypothetical protein|nr:hypothetical protein [Aliarcobacter sp.]MDX9960492.1 hypothetical protein [Aliarcobacter sp.]